MPQHSDPNYRANPIDAANLAIANLHAEREKLRQLVADYRQLTGWTADEIVMAIVNVNSDNFTSEWRNERDALAKRADALLE